MDIDADTQCIPGFPTYTASRDGRIYNCDGHEMKTHIDGGYQRIGLRRNGRPCKINVHTLVMLAFHGSPPSASHTVDHIDMDKNNNRLENLRYATKREQSLNRRKYVHRGRHPIITICVQTGASQEYPNIRAAWKSIRPDAKFNAGVHAYKAIKSQKEYHGYIWKRPSPRLGEYKLIPPTYVSEMIGYRAYASGHITNPEGRDIGGYVSETGYTYVGVGTKMYLIHRLIAQTFIPNPEGLPIVNHLDGDKSNSQLSNLEWTDSIGNSQHAVNTGLIKTKPVIQKTKYGRFLAEFQSATEAARVIGGHQGDISRCCLGKRPYASGYVWSFKVAKDE